VVGESGVDAEFRALERELGNLGLGGVDTNLEALGQHRAAILLWNQRVNLVSRRDEKKLIRYHFLDCAEGLTHLREGTDRRVLDLGSGAGFPGVVWKILRPDLDITLVDSIRKRALFLESVVEALGLEGVGIVRERGEELAEREDFAGQYDVGVARTVAPLWRLVGVCMPFLRPGGRLLAFKGRAVEEELAEAESVLKDKGGKLVRVAPARSETLRGKRIFVVIEKKAGL